METTGYFLIDKGAAQKVFERRSFELAAPQSGEVCIAVEQFGLNYADVMARKGLYREAPPFPCILGYEVVGKVIAVGDSQDDRILGKRVLAFTRFGGYAEHVCTQVHACIVIDDKPAPELLALCTQGVTAYYMANYLSPVRPGDKVLIHAAGGGVGTLLIQLCKAVGAYVIAKVGSPEKEALVGQLEADLIVNYKNTDYLVEIESKCGKQAVDVTFNAVGGITFKQDKQLLAHGGRMFLFGGAALGEGKLGILSQLNFLRKMGLMLPIGLMMGSRSVLGVNMLRIADHKPHVLAACLEAVVTRYDAGTLRPYIGGEFIHTDLAQAHTALESGLTTGKITISW